MSASGYRACSAEAVIHFIWEERVMVDLEFRISDFELAQKYVGWHGCMAYDFSDTKSSFASVYIGAFATIKARCAFPYLCASYISHPHANGFLFRSPTTIIISYLMSICLLF